MTLRPTDYALLSQLSYKDPKIESRGPEGVKYRRITLDGLNYEPIAHADSPSNGFQATAYERIDTHEIVIAYRGTEFDREPRQDGLADAGMAVNNINPQIRDAMDFTQQVMDMAQQRAKANHYAVNVTVTGHSLGGTLAEIAASENKQHGATFNAYGAVGLMPGITEGGSQVIDYVRATDVVSAASRHFGEVKVLATQQDVDALQRSGYHDSRFLNVVTPHVAILGGIQGDAHAIDNFVPDSKLLGHSIISPENEKRAEAHHGMIAWYRNDIALVRDVAFVGYQTQKPLIAGAKLALEAGQYVEQRTEQAYDTTRTTVILGTQAAKHLAERGYETARTQVAAGARAIEDHVEHAYESVCEAAVNGANALEHAAQGAFDTLGHPGSWFDSKPEPAAPEPAQLDDPDHPGHALYLQSRDAVYQIDAVYQRTPDQRSDNLAGALAARAHSAGMSRVDQVALSEDGAQAFAVQNGAQTQTTHVQTAAAVQTSLAQSSAAWQQVTLHGEKALPRQQAPSPALQSQQHHMG